MIMVIALACDHGAFDLKEAMKAYLEEKGHTCKDFGCYTPDSVDYAPIAAKAAHAVADGEATYGVFCCTTGIGISIAANKVKGIRAALCVNAHCAEMTRRHNNANVLCMGGALVDVETAKGIVDTFLSMGFEGDTEAGARHARRVSQIALIENGEL
jgi:ribose 5-phosphate isomerase B